MGQQEGDEVSASEKLAALDAAMTKGPWVQAGDGCLEVGGQHNFELADPDSAGIVVFRNALPELVALVAAAEVIAGLRSISGDRLANLDAALNALDRVLP